MKLHCYPGDENRAHRLRLRLTQGMLWSALGVTQSGGARYRSGRPIPLPVMVILNLMRDLVRGDPACCCPS